MATPNFSSDIIFEILTHTQLQALGTCRLVCKEWNHMTYESGFTQLHREKSNLETVSGYFMQSKISDGDYSSEFVSNHQHSSSSPTMSLSFMPMPVKIEASCHQGLLFCVSQNPQSVFNHRVPKYYVCKPSTKQWQLVPNPKTKYFTDRTAIIVTQLQPLHYKIARLSHPKSCETSKETTITKLRCEVFDSKRWAWKTLKEIKLPLFNFLDYDNPAISANGSAHWLTDNDLLFTFNVEKEIWTVSSLPKPPHGEINYKKKHLLAYERYIALACILDPSKSMEVDLWVMDRKGEQEEWRKRGTFNIDALPTAFYNADIAVATCFNEVMFHKLHDCSCNVVKLEKISQSCNVFPYKSDLEPSDLRGGGN